MERREQASGRKMRSDTTATGKDACLPRSNTGRLIARSVKTGQFTRTEIKKAIRKVASQRLAECQPDG